MLIPTHTENKVSTLKAGEEILILKRNKRQNSFIAIQSIDPIHLKHSLISRQR